MKTLYIAHAVTVEGREGHTQTDDKVIDMSLSKPGAGLGGTNPEQLFACGYSACFGSAIAAIAKKKQIELDSIEVAADVSLNQDDDNGFFIGVALNVKLSGVENTVAQELVQKAHQVCPYSKATRGNIEVTLKVNDEALTAKAA